MKKLSIALFAVAGIACTLSGATQIPGTPRFQNNDTAAGYQSPAVKAELKINVKDDTKEVLFVQDSTDPFDRATYRNPASRKALIPKPQSFLTPHPHRR